MKLTGTLLKYWENKFETNFPNTPMLVDGHRVGAATELVIHHSAGAKYKNRDALYIQNVFDAVGKKRGYRNKEHSYHYHPQLKKESFSQAHFALHEYTKDLKAVGVKYGWRLVPLIHGVMQNVTWHASNWEINKKAIGIEVCGNYMKQPVAKGAIDCVWWWFVGYATWLIRHAKKLRITGHKDHAATGCPGKIYEQLPYLRNRLAGVV